MSEAPTPDASLTSASKCLTLGQTLYKPSTKPAHSLTVGLNLSWEPSATHCADKDAEADRLPASWPWRTQGRSTPTSILFHHDASSDGEARRGGEKKGNLSVAESLSLGMCIHRPCSQVPKIHVFLNHPLPKARCPDIRLCERSFQMMSYNSFGTRSHATKNSTIECLPLEIYFLPLANVSQRRNLGDGQVS